MPNLFICLTPLQALIAQALIRQTAQPADLLMVCYPEAHNAKFQHYYQQTAAQCRRSHYHIVPAGKWQRALSLPRLLNGLDRHYHTLYAASIDNPNVQYPASHLTFDRLETFDDGTGNLYPQSILYQSTPSLKRRLLNALQGIHHTTQSLRQLSRQHHTLYPNLPNIVHPTTPLQLWQRQPETQPNPSQANPTTPIHILLGQPLYHEAPRNAALMQRIAAQFPISHYFPHPREHHPIPHLNYIHTPLIFEDWLLQHIQCHPHTPVHLYHLISTAALNVSTFPNVHIHSIRPQDELFHRPSYAHLYQLMPQLGIEVIDLKAA